MVQNLKSKHYLAAFILFLLSWTAWADSPLGMLQSTSQRMLAELKANKPQLKSNPGIINRIVRTVVVPHVNLPAMSRTVLGRDAWSTATPAQRQQFMQEFTTMVIRTYSSSLSAYNDQKVEFFPLRGGSEGSQVEVDSRIIQSDGPSIAVSYRLTRDGGDWKIYDFSVEGVSMLESFRSQFAAQLERGNLEQLLQTMRRHNAGV